MAGVIILACRIGWITTRAAIIFFTLKEKQRKWNCKYIKVVFHLTGSSLVLPFLPLGL